MKHNGFSFFRAPARNTTPSGEMTVKSAYEYITKDAGAKVRTDVLRVKQRPEERRAYKADCFDIACFSGLFSQRLDSALVKHSGLLCLDLDHVGTWDDVCQLRRRLIGDPQVCAALSFVSPSGDGLKHVVTIDLERGDHRAWFHAIRHYLRQNYGVEADRMCVNVSRACFLPHDESCWVHPNVLVDEVLPMSTLDVDEWADHDASHSPSRRQDYAPRDTSECRGDELMDEVTALVDEITMKGIDITVGYEAWRDIGFALADGLGEQGRQAFHELSRLNAEYDTGECDRQYTKCLNGHGTGITIRTLFHMAREAGIDLVRVNRLASARQDFFPISPDSQPSAEQSEDINSLIFNDAIGETEGWENEKSEKNPGDDAQNIVFSETFSDKISREEWPSMLLPVLDSADDAEARDKMLLGSLTVMSGLFCHNYYGVYNNLVVYSPFYLIIYGPSASGKGDVGVCQRLMKPFNEELKARFQQELETYSREHAEWESKGSKADRGPEPREPQFRTVTIPVNSSSSAAYQALDANGGWGIMFESEADVLTQSLQSDYGDYSTGLRQAFHHEPITLKRVKEKLHIDIQEPRLAVCLTCTPGQLPRLFPSFENGLGSRFLFFGLNRKLVWRDPFAKREKTQDEIYGELGEQCLDLYHQLKGMGSRRIQFVLSAAQASEFNACFDEMLHEQFWMLGDGIVSFVLRMGLCTFRFTMLLALLRRYSEWDREKPLFESQEQALVCSDVDFHIAMTIMNTLVNHTGKIYGRLGGDKDVHDNPQLAQLSGSELQFYRALPDSFDREEMLRCAEKLGISRTSGDRYIGKFITETDLLRRIKNGHYCKVEPQKQTRP